MTKEKPWRGWALLRPKGTGWKGWLCQSERFAKAMKSKGDQLRFIEVRMLDPKTGEK